MRKLFKPEIFQGTLSKQNYFEGWYFKHVSASENQVYAFIPGISLSKTDAHAFIQVINGITGETHYITYDKHDFTFKNDRLHVQIGKSVFTDQFIELDIDKPGIEVKGRLNYSGLSKFPSTFWSPGIMGWYSFVPFMECYHGVVSANHLISGSLQINNETVDFNSGKGYIEKDWGTSFPESWIWLQSNSFVLSDVSLFVSVAKIPWLGKFFIGFIAFVYFNGKYYKFATYNGSKLTKLNHTEDSLTIELKNTEYKLTVNANYRNSGELIAPVAGTMSRRIKESIDSAVEFQLFDSENNLLLEQQTQRAGLEIIEKIFSYFE